MLTSNLAGDGFGVGHAVDKEIHVLGRSGHDRVQGFFGDRKGAAHMVIEALGAGYARKRHVHQLRQLTAGHVHGQSA